MKIVSRYQTNDIQLVLPAIFADLAKCEKIASHTCILTYLYT